MNYDDLIRVNLGCGDRYAEGWVNVDLPTTPHRVDVAADLREPLPFDDATIKHAYAGHVFEHLTVGECERLAVDLLKKMVFCGELMVVGPDVPTARDMVARGDEMHGETLDSLINGAGRWAGDVHHWEWSSEMMAICLREAGWVSVHELGIERVSTYWPVAERRPRWQRAVHAMRSCG